MFADDRRVLDFFRAERTGLHRTPQTQPSVSKTQKLLLFRLEVLSRDDPLVHQGLQLPDLGGAKHEN